MTTHDDKISTSPLMKSLSNCLMALPRRSGISGTDPGLQRFTVQKPQDTQPERRAVTAIRRPPHRLRSVHDSVLSFVERKLSATHVGSARVLEVGSCDVNGSVRPYIESLGCTVYTGVDKREGPRVDVVADCEQLTDAVGSGMWDVVISTEMLEHVTDWRACMRELVAAVAPNGYLLLTTRSPGFPYHPQPVDCWRYTKADMHTILTGVGLDVVALEDDEPDTPGVLAFARKPHDWKPCGAAWADLIIATPR
jgi:hypothetical protein